MDQPSDGCLTFYLNVHIFYMLAVATVQALICIQRSYN